MGAYRSRPRLILMGAFGLLLLSIPLMIGGLRSGGLSAGAVKARRPRADHARGRSEATSLARRRAQLETRWRDGPPGTFCLERRRSRFRDAGASARSRQMTGERCADAGDDHTAETGDDDSGERQPGRERPSLESALGRSRAVKNGGRSRPGSLLRLFGAVNAGGTDRRPVKWPRSSQRGVPPRVGLIVARVTLSRARKHPGYHRDH